MYQGNLDPAVIIPSLDDKYVKKAHIAFNKAQAFNNVMASREDVVLKDKSETRDPDPAPHTIIPYYAVPLEDGNTRSLVIALSLLMTRDKAAPLNQFSGYISIVHMMAKRLKDQAIDAMLPYGYQLVPIEVASIDEHSL